MIIWINGAFGSGKTTTAFELHRRLPNSFIYDPENVGYFIRKNSPEMFSKGDFQNIPLWRSMNYEMFKLIIGCYDGTIIVPMTLVNKDYYEQIIGKLRSDGIEVKHYILYAKKETIQKRLKIRGLNPTHWGVDSFALQSIDRCIDAFDHHICETKIMTDDITVEEVVEEIARLSKISLLTDQRSKIKKKIDQLIVLIKHIR